MRGIPAKEKGKKLSDVARQNKEITLKAVDQRYVKTT